MWERFYFLKCLFPQYFPLGFNKQNRFRGFFFSRMQSALWVTVTSGQFGGDVYFIVHSFLFSVNVRHVHRLSVWAQCIFTAWLAQPPLPQRSPLKVCPIFPAWRQWMPQRLILSASLLWGSAAFHVAEAYSCPCQIQDHFTALLPFILLWVDIGPFPVWDAVLLWLFWGMSFREHLRAVLLDTHPASDTCVRVEYTRAFFTELGY